MVLTADTVSILSMVDHPVEPCNQGARAGGALSLTALFLAWHRRCHACSGSLPRFPHSGSMTWFLSGCGGSSRSGALLRTMALAAFRSPIGFPFRGSAGLRSVPTSIEPSLIFAAARVTSVCFAATG